MNSDFPKKYWKGHSDGKEETFPDPSGSLEESNDPASLWSRRGFLKAAGFTFAVTTSYWRRSGFGIQTRAPSVHP